jgi:hypothetical protein
MKKQVIQALRIMVFLASTTLSLRGSVVLLSNMDQPTQNSPNVVTRDVFQAAPFTTGDSSAIFDSATILVASWEFAEGNFWVTLYNDDAGVPGSQLPGVTLEGPSMPRSNGAYTYSATSEVILAPSTRYWLVASSDFATPNFNYGWYNTLSYDYSSPAGWQLPGYQAFTTDGGATWTSTEDALIPRPFKFEITGSTIPEPATFTLLGLGSVALWMVRRR